MPDLSNFSVYSSGRSQNFSIINGQMSSSISNTFILTPKSPGKFIIGPFSVSVDNQTYQTQPINIEVVNAQSQPQSAPAGQAQRGSQAPGAFVSLTIDKRKVYVNEQVVMAFRFYCRVPLVANPEYQPPEKTGFTFEDLPPPRNFSESAHGAQYQVTEIKTALFPTKAGTLTVPSAALKIRVEDMGDPFANDFFRQFFRGGGREYLLKTEPVTCR